MAMGGLLALTAFALVATITPGGATTLATSSGARFGLRRSVPMLSGIVAALAVMAAAAAAGLGSLILAAPALRLALEIVGTAYLLWLAVRTARRGAPDDSSGGEQPLSFAKGAGLLLYNPKGWAMTVAAAASFAGLLADPVWLAALFGVVFAVASTVSLAVWCSLGVVLSRLIRTSRQWRAVNGLLALLLLASIVPIWL